MMQQTEFWKLGHLSHAQLLESLHRVMLIKRRALAELIAHLVEVEERRLHLEAAHSSLFDYCVARLGMSEDEACRRIELARLARSYPALFPLLASGEITLSVALVLKPILSPANHEELLAAARCKSIREARELVARRAPRPDTPSSIRKLPERRAGEGAPALPLALTSACPSAQQQTPASTAPAAPVRTAPPRQQSRVEPLSPQRYKVQFTVDGAVKDQLEQARDLLRHAIPSGDFGEIMARALELLIADQLRRRFGAGARHEATRAGTSSPPGSQASTPPGGSPARGAPHIPRAARRAVHERDGLACTWRDADGKRCGSRAWLEIDHRHPRDKGGASNPENLRILCRAHNHLAAEREYGRAHIERSTHARQSATQAPSP